MHKTGHGFTLIELIVVIVILGVLGAVALPRFIDLRSDAERAAVEGFIGGLRSAHSLAFVKMMLNGIDYQDPANLSLISITRCDNVPQLGTTDTNWGGHYIALAGIRGAVFADVNQQACNGNTISFTTKTQRVITITNAAGGINWAASPAY